LQRYFIEGRAGDAKHQREQYGEWQDDPPHPGLIENGIARYSSQLMRDAGLKHFVAQWNI
jgi:hypothetical protein